MIVEVVLVVLISAVVTNIATQFVTEILAQDDNDDTTGGPSDGIAKEITYVESASVESGPLAEEPLGEDKKIER